MVDSPSAVMMKKTSVPEIKPLDRYDFNRAKIRASVRWLLSKSYGSADAHNRGTEQEGCEAGDRRACEAREAESGACWYSGG
ncbi:calmodulin-regulated spectrin-associated protein 2-like [Anarrhichthys ocellatus]|uniref:calmodulin-regulated spectrin-associated protein 2-like n=1 Tax=Anarrhichthys ocellatus TaxID=433405 RepID=UPI0012EDC570|nr:calmodulin-regulated spectrin-associated protein 2-like [Anarrhichthys ocellatus]